jgi:hypothetical protein
VTLLAIDGISFKFDDSWSIIKWDESRWYLEAIYKLNGQLDDRPEGTKAVDAVGIRDGVPYLFEVKDFRGVAIENKQRQLHELPLEVGLKARDTVAGLLGWVALGKQDELPLRWVRAAHDQRQRVRVVALLAEDASRPGEPSHKRDARELERASRLKQRLAWLTPRVLVNDPLRDTAWLQQMGMTTQSAANAGPARRR